MLVVEDGVEFLVEYGVFLLCDLEDMSWVLFVDECGVYCVPVVSLWDVICPLICWVFLEEVFSYFGRFYGWGGHVGGLDCLCFVMDVFVIFGLELFWYSGW